jgi:hypothetical protein
MPAGAQLLAHKDGAHFKKSDLPPADVTLKALPILPAAL